MRKDRWLWGALAAGLLLRVLPMFLWPQTDCVRDECIYRALAQGILSDGVLGETTKGWLSAPGYPYLLAFFRRATGSWFTIKWLQIAASLTSIPVLYAITARLTEGLRAPRWAAWLLALHPTIAWYSNTWWIETFYIALLLPAVLLVLDRPHARHGAGAGLLLGIAILFRGIATYLPPIFALGLLLDDRPFAERLKPAGALLLASVLTVAPYSLYASSRYGGFVVSDATMGHVLFLGNNDFEPMTFDYGNGALTQPHYYAELRTGRKPCPRQGPPVPSSRCDTAAAIDWVRQNPGTFAARVPLRLAQQLNPHTFFTRHLRWGYFWGVDGLLEELLVLWILLTSVGTVLGGTLAGLARGTGRYAVLAGGIIVYTFATAAVSYGMSRFRLPLEPLWLVYLALFLAEPRTTLQGLKEPVRGGLALVLLPVLIWLGSWYWTTGFPLLWR